MEKNELKLAPEKTEALLITRKRKREGISFKLGNVTITSKESVKYLGVHFDTRGSFGEHIKQTKIKAEDRVGKLTRLMSNIGGPASSRRAVLSGVVHSILLYGAPIWAEALKKKKYFLEMERTQRKILIRIASAYRTAPTVGLQVITGIPPIDLLALERKEIFENPEEVGHTIVRNRTIQEWQKRWNENTNKVDQAADSRH